MGCHPILKEQTLSLSTVNATRTKLETVVLGTIGQAQKDKWLITIVMTKSLNSSDTQGLKIKWWPVGGVEEKWGKVSVMPDEIYSRNLRCNFVPQVIYSDIHVNLLSLL